MRRAFYIWVHLLGFLVLMLPLSTHSCSISRVLEIATITKQLSFFRKKKFLILILKSTRKLPDFNILLQELKLYSFLHCVGISAFEETSADNLEMVLFHSFPIPSPHSRSLVNLFHLKNNNKLHTQIPSFCFPLSQTAW